MAQLSVLSRVLACGILTAAMATPVLADLPTLVPRDALFSAPERTAPKISPDGTRLSYLGRSPSGVTNVFVRPFDSTDARQITSDERRGIQFYSWAQDGEHLLYVQDRDGDENWHLYATRIATGETKDLTPYDGVRAGNVITHSSHPKHVLVGMNRRDPRVADMYRVHIETGETALEAENPGGVVEWVTDEEFVIRACAGIDEDASAIIRVRDSADDDWRVLQKWEFEDAGFDRYQRIIGFAPGGRSLQLQSCAGTNTTQIIDVDLATGEESVVIPADPKCDLWNTLDFSLAYTPVAVHRDERTGRIRAHAVYDMKPEWRVRDPAMKKDFARLATMDAGTFDIVSCDKADARWIVHFESDVSPSSYHLYDRATGKLTLLFKAKPLLDRYTFSEMQIVRYTARDGLDIPAYLTLPAGVPAKNLPMVLLPHGGPWFRDYWGFDSEVQWLANRGYAVLQPQFRGSIGFGKAFVAASNGEMGVGHMQHDLTDAVKWAVDQGIADPARVGIMGASYGGYATLAGLAFTPEVYACGVDIVGVSNMKTSFEAFPPYWAPRLRRWINRVGNVLEDDELNRRISPVFHVDRIRAPLLIGHGANDVRVTIGESNQIVEAMRKNGREVTYVVYPDEGHGFARPQNNADFNGRVEEFLAKHLGGRKEAWKALEGSTAELR